MSNYTATLNSNIGIHKFIIYIFIILHHITLAMWELYNDELSENLYDKKKDLHILILFNYKNNMNKDENLEFFMEEDFNKE